MDGSDFIAAGKGNHTGDSQQLKNLADGAAGNAVEAIGKADGINVHKKPPENKKARPPREGE